MGEAKNNPTAQTKAEGKIAPKEKDDQMKVNPISVESILIITDLAQIGHTHLSQLLPDMRKVVAEGGSNLTAEQLRKFEQLVADGPEVIAHFSNMCQYIYESAKQAKDASEKEEKDNG